MSGLQADVLNMPYIKVFRIFSCCERLGIVVSLEASPGNPPLTQLSYIHQVPHGGKNISQV